MSAAQLAIRLHYALSCLVVSACGTTPFGPTPQTNPDASVGGESGQSGSGGNGDSAAQHEVTP